MRKTIFALCGAVAALGTVSAQDNLLQFYPNEEGTQIISKCYDANDVEQGTMVITVMKDYEYLDGQQLDLNFVITDAEGNVKTQGKIDADYFDQTFRMDMKMNALSPTLGQSVSMLTELGGDFLDYPNMFPDPRDLEGDFEMDGGTFSIKDPETKRPIATVRKYNRQIDGTEHVKTPAGEYDATKISFTVEVDQDGQRNTYRGQEWYHAGAGIVKSEIYDTDKNLLEYTVLTAINKPSRR